MNNILNFYKDKKVLITGGTGFKGSWLCEILLKAGAEVYCYALTPEKESLWNILNLEYRDVQFCDGDITNYKWLHLAMTHIQPDIVFHLAAQPIVLKSYEEPVNTFNTNVMGTVNLLECVRNMPCVKSLVNITTDKVYLNNNSGKNFIETDYLCGSDPYSNSKSCSELITYSYYHSFFENRNLGVATVRAGNVIGGGDFAENRIIPDCYRDSIQNKDIIIRNPNSYRPYQHVLDALFAYLIIGKDFYEQNKFDSFNIGPDEAISSGNLAQIFCDTWGNNQKWVSLNNNTNLNKEAKLLMLDTTHLKDTYNWKPCWDSNQAIEKSVEWYKAYANNENMEVITQKQIDIFMESFVQ